MCYCFMYEFILIYNKPIFCVASLYSNHRIFSALNFRPNCLCSLQKLLARLSCILTHCVQVCVGKILHPTQHKTCHLRDLRRYRNSKPAGHRFCLQRAHAGTDGQTPCRFIDPPLHTMQVLPITIQKNITFHTYIFNIC